MRRLNNLKFLRTWTKTLKSSSKKEMLKKCPRLLYHPFLPSLTRRKRTMEWEVKSF